MTTKMQTKVFWTVVAFTSCCVLLATAIALLPVFVANAESTPFLDPMFKTLTHLFSTGIGAIFTMLGMSSLK